MGNKPQSYSKKTIHDTDGDGEPDYTSIEWKNYNKQGILLEEGYKFDFDNDGAFDAATVTRNTVEKGRIVSTQHLEDTNQDGELELIGTTLNTFDKKGNMTFTETVYDWNQDGDGDQSFSETRTFDKKGNVTTYLYESDFEADGVTDYADYREYGYNRDQLVWETIDFGYDGSIDQLISYNYGVYDYAVA